MGAVPGALLHLEEVAEAEVAGGDLHGAVAGVDDGGFDTVADVLADDAAEEPGAGGVDGDGAGGVEAAGVGVEAAVEGVDLEDVGEGAHVIGIGKLAPGGGGYALPWVPVHVLLSVRYYHSSPLAL